MPAIRRDSLLTLESYAKARADFRAKVLAHKRNRIVQLGEHVTLLFEDELTVRYQIQEMLRIEKTFEDAGIQDELDAYNPLVPDGTNLKATMQIEYEDADERRAGLARLVGIEDRTWVAVEGHAKVYAIADEDLPRENAEQDLGRAFPALRARAGNDRGARAWRRAWRRHRPPELHGGDSGRAAGHARRPRCRPPRVAPAPVVARARAVNYRADLLRASFRTMAHPAASVGSDSRPKAGRARAWSAYAPGG